MAKVLEKGILDTITGGRNFRKGFKLSNVQMGNYRHPNGSYGRLHEMLYRPRTNFDRFVGNVVERIIPGIRYFFWDDQVKWARTYGYTIQEHFYHNWMRSENFKLHAMAQQIHPFGYMEQQRRDNMMRRVVTLIKGVEAPEWADRTRRVPEMDLASIRNPFRSWKEVQYEATPTPHRNTSSYWAPQHILNRRHELGSAADRAFYNEEIRGEWYKRGSLNELDKEIVNGYYAHAQEGHAERLRKFNPEDKAEYLKNKQRWDANMDKLYPELKGAKCDLPTHKYQEAYYERNMQDIRSSIFTSKWIEALQSNKFNDTEIQQIHEFFLNEQTQHFFELNEEDAYVPTELYTKFIDVLDFVNLFKLDRFTANPPEHQFYNALDTNWMINFDTVDAYRQRFFELVEECNKSYPEARDLVLEEVYNPLFRSNLQEITNANLTQRQSYTVEALKSGKVNVSELNEMAKTARENVYITSNNVLDQFVKAEVRKVVKTFTYQH